MVAWKNFIFILTKCLKRKRKWNDSNKKSPSRSHDYLFSIGHFDTINIYHLNDLIPLQNNCQIHCLKVVWKLFVLNIYKNLHNLWIEQIFICMQNYFTYFWRRKKSKLCFWYFGKKFIILNIVSFLVLLKSGLNSTNFKFIINFRRIFIQSIRPFKISL